MKDWKKFFFKEVVHFPPEIKLTKGKKYPYVELADIDKGYKNVYSANQKIYEGSGSKFANGDTLFARITPSLENGKIAQVKNLKTIGFGSGEFFVFRGKENITDSDYVYYLSKTKSFKDHAINSMVGASGRQRADQNFVGKTEINLPPLSTQKRIGKILSKYDDLIDYNLKQVKLLQEVLKLTYEEWFLRFRINDQKLKINSVTMLPFGWKKINVGSYCEIISKGPSLNYDLESSPGIPVLNQSCIRNGEIELQKVLFAKKLKEDKSSSYLKINDILINSMGKGTLGRVSKNVSIDDRMIIHNCITYLRSKDIYSQYLLFYFISLHQTYFESIASGSTDQSTLKIERISDLSITVPDKDTMAKFDMVASNYWSQIGILKKENQLLKEARDILLPRLMTGMIDVENMDITV